MLFRAIKEEEMRVSELFRKWWERRKSEIDCLLSTNVRCGMNDAEVWVVRNGTSWFGMTQRNLNSTVQWKWSLNRKFTRRGQIKQFCTFTIARKMHGFSPFLAMPMHCFATSSPTYSSRNNGTGMAPGSTSRSKLCKKITPYRHTELNPFTCIP